ncbi:hypothetical protein RN001_003782 [Aquatica leii]|uniref:Uncharacterized protein n=1 Tax=Aquatica leii TaxID=1421715 RepID=A0AAN7PRI1_9COLE|nr:hypothetical protein RN001_003782 [Aquatica leii]
MNRGYRGGYRGRGRGGFHNDRDEQDAPPPQTSKASVQADENPAGQNRRRDHAQNFRRDTNSRVLEEFSKVSLDKLKSEVFSEFDSLADALKTAHIEPQQQSVRFSFTTRGLVIRMASTNKFLTDAELEDIINSNKFWEDMDDNYDRTENIATADDEAEAGQTILNNADISDEDEQDIEIFSDHDTVSDFEYLSDQENIISGDNKSKDESTIDLTSKRSKLAWYGKDNTKWAKEAPKKSKVKSHNLLRILPGPRGPARNNPPSCPIEAWKQFITDDMLNVIVNVIRNKLRAGTVRGSVLTGISIFNRREGKDVAVVIE